MNLPLSESVSIHHLQPLNLSLGFCLVGVGVLFYVCFLGEGENEGKVGAGGGGSGANVCL